MSHEYLAFAESRIAKSGMVENEDAIRDDIYLKPIWDAPNGLASSCCRSVSGTMISVILWLT